MRSVIVRGKVLKLRMTLSSGLAVARFVATVPGAIAYLSPDVADRSIKRVRIDGLPVFPAQSR